MSSSRIIYQKTQWFHLLGQGLAIFIAIDKFVLLQDEPDSWPGVWFHVLVFLSMVVLVGLTHVTDGRLVVRVTEKDLELVMGRGWKKKTVPLEAIKSVKVVEVPYTRQKKSPWCFAKTGVEVICKDGEEILVGTSEPEMVAVALQPEALSSVLEN
jgi:hypothetical protein